MYLSKVFAKLFWLFEKKLFSDFFRIAVERGKIWMDHQLTVEMDLFCFDANQEVKIYFFVKMLWFMEVWGIF